MKAKSIMGPNRARTMRLRMPLGRTIKSRFVVTSGDTEEDGYPKARAR